MRAVYQKKHVKKIKIKIKIEIKNKERKSKQCKAVFRRNLRSPPSSVMIMTREEEKTVKTALFSNGDPKEIVASIGTDTVQRGSFQTIKPGTWLK